MTPEDEVAGMGEVPRMEYGNVHHGNGNSKLAFRMLTGLGAVIAGLLLLALQALYTLNGTVSKIAGSQESAQRQEQQDIAEIHQEMSAFQTEIMAIAQRENNHGS